MSHALGTPRGPDRNIALPEQVENPHVDVVGAQIAAEKSRVFDLMKNPRGNANRSR